MFVDALNPIKKKNIKENWIIIKTKLSIKNRLLQGKINFKWWRTFRIRERNRIKADSKSIYKNIVLI